MRDGALLTAVIVRKQEGWRIWWADFGFGPGGAFDTLDWLVQSTDTLVSGSGGAFRTLDALVEATDALVLAREPTGVGTLQYKIHPWGRRPGVEDERLPYDICKIRAPGEGPVRGTQGPLVTRLWVVEDSHETVAEARPLAFHIYGNTGDLRAAYIASGADLHLNADTAGDLISQVAEIHGELPHNFTWIRAIQSLHAD